ncbi:MAG: copper amine oxidase N-terminal domain-containing protein, partial [Cellulosilyticaceae bacterium]
MMVNGAKVTLEAPAFLEKGKMMVPLRAVTEAFGIPSKDVVYSAGNIAIFANGRTISLSIGSTDAFVNGAKMTLANPAKIVNERTTVPVGDLGRLLGLKVEWDNAAKTATFTN